MIEYNELINKLMFTNVNDIVSLKLFLFVIFTFLLSLAIDIILGELPGRIHPVVIMGSIINFFKNMFINIRNRLSGVLTVLCAGIVLCILLLVIYFIFKINIVLLFIVFTILLSSTYSVNMLLQTAIDVKDDLNEDINKARRSVSYLVSRDTDELTESFIVSAVIESLTENITDSYVAPILYFFIFALIILICPIENHLYFLLLIPMLYRLSNTMDAMLGYKSDELIHIGFFPAKIDDILNYIPSRIAGLFVVISAFILGLDGKNSFNVMMRDARKCPSPNSGYTMASTAGALNIQLIKKDTYILGDSNKEIVADDISKAVNLSKLSIVLFTITVIVLFTLVYVIL
ncbi:MAG: cobalamin biosynthesis protein [Methanobrevibacter sp.]|uniref:cobalamin biosynthesis protein n=1 Tax=Methanobrevibacter sp. TaxID=66852 RepID=UPI0025CEC1D8|nr:cobalamin biosynthesis protein [Methanobrevibacter sp.]MBR6992863.1 cobalamin biosynthesis protein [Methanobrevibacter sp.]